MTVSYQYDVASSASGGFIRLLFRWRGSVWKVVYRDMLIFLVAYVMLTVIYQFALTESQQKIFEKIVYFCSTFMDLIPLSFMLGFYVSFIAARWWSQFIAIPWPDKLMNIVAMYIPGLDDASRVVRRTLMRYLNLSLVLVLRSISMAVKRRFPTKDHLVEAGFMTKTELEMFQSVPSTEFNTFWIPCTWFINVLREAKQECRITDSNGLKLIMEELNEFRSKCGLLWGYDWISIPLVYTQVVTMATYAFFVACMFGRQNVNTSGEPNLRAHRYDYYIPIFTILQLMFYMGLLKVAEQLINPFGDDDEDFELNWIIDRHMKVSYLGVDTLNGTPPPLVKDNYYDELDVKIPYTEASRSYKKKTYRGSVAYMQVPMEQQGMVLPDQESDDEKETISEGMGQRRPSTYTLFQMKTTNKGSPSSSHTNLDNASLDSDWKCSLTNLSNWAKNSSGSTGYSYKKPTAMEMDNAEDDEMVLQEVVIDPKKPIKSPLERSDSLQIPNVTDSKGKKSSSLLSVMKDISPKIAPKFPREKLKSMFRKRKMSAVFPFIKVKGVRFSRDTKEHDGSSSDESSADEHQDEDELEITISDPELTETEKRMGIHPYYAQQKAASPEKLAQGFASLSRKIYSGGRRNSHDGLSDIPVTNSQSPRCCSLPNIQVDPTVITTRISRAQTSPSCKSVSAKRDKSRRAKRKKKSPPPSVKLVYESTDQEQQSDKDQISETPDDSNRNTLPQITVTRYGQKNSDHLHPGASTSNEQRSDSCIAPSEVPALSTKKQSSASRTLPPAKRPELKQSTPQSEQMHSTPHEQIKSSPKPKPKRTSSLSLQSKPPIHIRTPSPSKPKPNGQQAKSRPSLTLPLKVQAPTGALSSSDSAPSSPTRIIPKLIRTPSIPLTPKKLAASSPRHSISSTEGLQERRDSRSQVSRAQPQLSSESEEISATVTNQNKQSRTREPPVPVPRKGSKGKK